MFFTFTLQIATKRGADERTQTAFLLITRNRSGVAGVCTGLDILHFQAVSTASVCCVLHCIAIPVVSEWCQYHPHTRGTPSSTGGQPDLICGRRRVRASIDPTFR
jgi:hypothetical protein